MWSVRERLERHVDDKGTGPSLKESLPGPRTQEQSRGRTETSYGGRNSPEGTGDKNLYVGAETIIREKEEGLPQKRYWGVYSMKRPNEMNHSQRKVIRHTKYRRPKTVKEDGDDIRVVDHIPVCVSSFSR